MFDWTTVFNDAVLLGGFGGLLNWFLKNKGSILKVGEEVVQDVVALAKTPAGKVIEGELHLKLDALTKQFRESEIGRLAAAGLNAFDEELNQLSNEQKVALVIEIGKLLPPDWKVTQSEIEKALEVGQKASEAFSATKAVELANEFKQEIAVPPAQPTATTEQTQTPA